ncbi:MAG: metallophosphoesterase family protein [Verrucomicrobiae bacterium]|nr:metallophosphoesterase family protein [Verrucomicrobiae bacterium]
MERVAPDNREGGAAASGFPRKIRVLSDLHLGHPGCRVREVEALRPLLEDVPMLVLNGDTSEQRHSQLVERGREQLDAFRALAERTGTRLVFLRGNHDPEASTLDRLDLAEGRVFLTHGDALFRHLSPWSPKIWRVIPDMERLRAEYGEDRLLDDLDLALECAHRCRAISPGYENEFKTGPLKHARTLARIAWPPRRPVNILKTWLSVPRLAHAFAARFRPGARLFLFGHTHFPGVWREGGRLVVNTGGFLSMLPARCVDLDGEVAIVRAVRETGGRFAPGRERVRVALD